MNNPDQITDLPIISTTVRVPVKTPKKGERKTEDKHIPHFHHYTKDLWQARYYLHPESNRGAVEIVHQGELMIDASGYVAMMNAIEMIDHWVATGYKPRVIQGGCLADHSPGQRFNAANRGAGGKGVRPFVV